MRDAFDSSDRPPPGTECERCRRLYQHFCQAKGYRGATALCLECGADIQCATTAAVIRRLGPSDDTLALPSDAASPDICIARLARVIPPEEWTESDKVAPTANHPDAPYYIRQELRREERARTIAPPAAPDLMRRGNGRAGLRNGSTPVGEITQRLRGGESSRDVAAATGVAKNTVLSVRRGLDDLPPPIIGAPSHRKRDVIMHGEKRPFQTVSMSEMPTPINKRTIQSAIWPIFEAICALHPGDKKAIRMQIRDAADANSTTNKLRSSAREYAPDKRILTSRSDDFTVMWIWWQRQEEKPESDGSAA